MTTTAPTKNNDIHQLDRLTGGAFTAPTSGERAARVRDWLASGPGAEQLQDVFKELSARDKGAAKPLREKLDEIKRARSQELMAQEWGCKAQALLALPKLNIADAMAWQRDAAKAGAPLSKEPLAALKGRLVERVKVIEDLQHRVQVQREAAVLLAQRIEVLSTKSWLDAQAVWDGLRADVAHWQAQAVGLQADSNWPSVDLRFPPLLEGSRGQLLVVWEAFDNALALTVAAAQDPAAALPPVPVWAGELRHARGVAAEPPAKSQRPKVDPEIRAHAVAVVRDVLGKLELEIAEGHGKASAGAATALRNALKEFGKLVGEKLESQAHVALSAAGELEGWQRWRADQLRAELVAKAEALLQRPAPRARTAPARGPAVAPVAPVVETHEAPAPATQAADPAIAATGIEPDAEPGAEPDAEAATSPSGEVLTVPAGERQPDAAADGPGNFVGEAPPGPAQPRFGGRKMQEALRSLREQWKQTDQGGSPNHAMWKRFDEACNEAYKVVAAWLEKVKAESAEHKAQRLALIEEVRAWAVDNTTARDGDWKGFSRVLHQFGDRWRDSGHLGEKVFADLQAQWLAAINMAAAPLEAMQKQSLERRHGMIEEARVLGAAPVLHIDAVKALQQRWQAEVHAVPLDRRHEQKLWDAFRKPVDDAFNRKTAERERAEASLSARDRAVLDAAQALEVANSSRDAQSIRAAIGALEAATRAQAQGRAPAAAGAVPASVHSADAATAGPADSTSPAAAPLKPDAADGAGATGESDPALAAPVAVPAPRKPVVAVRGDDRPGMRKSEPVPAGRPGKFGAGRDGGGSGPGPNTRPGERGPRPDAREFNAGAGRFPDRPRSERSYGAPQTDAPRLGDAAFRAQREALERADMALRKLAAQAHGEVLTHLLTAWEKRDPALLPSAQELGGRANAAMRNAWAQALGGAGQADTGTAILRLEMAAEVPTPADELSARRMLQLQLLTRRNDPGPAQTWGQDLATVLGSGFAAERARRVQNALKVLLK